MGNDIETSELLPFAVFYVRYFQFLMLSKVFLHFFWRLRYCVPNTP